MKQVLVKGGKVQVETVPPPTVAPGTAVVQVSHSLISSGTESGFVSDGGTTAFVMKKAKDPLNVEKVKRKLASVGVKGTLEVIKNKLFEFQAPGYSTAGVITECAPDVVGLRVGDRVACSGVGYASHAEYNQVPQQLLTPIPEGVSFEEAAFVTLGAIAMQGVRRAAPTFGETILVVGLGLLGQLAAQITRAAGCHVIGCDPIAEKRTLAKELGADVVCSPNELDAVVQEWTGGYGVDAVVICAASKNSAVTNQALDLCRPKGRVSVVGAVGLQLQREPLYLKELDFFISCSYGPGRYNHNYEERGLDYPIGYVRWTEGRNMAEFLRMVAEKKVQVKPLISVIKPVEEAQAAYDAILSGETNAISALISYGAIAEATPTVPPRIMTLTAAKPKTDSIGVAVIGAGGLAKTFHLPNLKRFSGCHLEAVVNRTGPSSKQAAEKFGARYCTTDYREVLADPNVHAVLCATRHDLHKEIALAALEAGKHVFMEKPLALTLADCDEICEAVHSADRLLTVGFNRRFSPWAQQAKLGLQHMNGPKMIVYRCNAGSLPPNHWAVDPIEGGGRIRGEAVHFIDLCCWLLDADPIAVGADRIDIATTTEVGAAPVIAEDNLSATLRFPDGSLATIIYCALGHPGVSKEQIEIFGGGGAIVIDDFMGVTFAGLPGKTAHKSRVDKGMYGMLENFVLALQGKAALDVTAAHGRRATDIACRILEACQGSKGGNA